MATIIRIFSLVLLIMVWAIPALATEYCHPGNVKTWSKSFRSGSATSTYNGHGAWVHIEKPHALIADRFGYALLAQTGSVENIDPWLIRLDCDGNVVWNKRYESGQTEIPYAMIQSSDGGYIIVGKKGTGPAYFDHGTSDDAFIMKVNWDGDIEWQKILAQEGEIFDIAYDVKQTQDGGFIVAGSRGTPWTGVVHAGVDCMVWRLNAEGEILWQKGYGGQDIVSHGGHPDEWATSILITADGGFLLSASARLGWADEIWLAKLSRIGDVVWQYVYHLEGSYDPRVIPAKNDGYLVVSSHAQINSSNIWVLKINGSGQILWQKVFGGGEQLHLDLADGRNPVDSVLLSPKGGYVIAGNTMLPDTQMRVYLLKIEENGGVVWERQYGIEGQDMGSSVVESFDGGLLVSAIETNFGQGGDDIWLLKLNSEGKLGGVSNCVADVNKESSITTASISPMPTNAEPFFGEYDFRYLSYSGDFSAFNDNVVVENVCEVRYKGYKKWRFPFFKIFGVKTAPDKKDS